MACDGCEMKSVAPRVTASAVNLTNIFINDSLRRMIATPGSQWRRRGGVRLKHKLFGKVFINLDQVVNMEGRPSTRTPEV